ncbi:MAG: hypothetical protein Q8N45_00085 [Anaerolineales bacterium]|nr:hypothetical protein [Anaerolineales bacterium]
MDRKFSHLFILIVILSFFSLSIQNHAAPPDGITTRVSLASVCTPKARPSRPTTAAGRRC